MAGAEHGRDADHPRYRRRVNGGCFIVAMHYVRPNTPEFPVEAPDKPAGRLGTLHKNGEPICHELLGYNSALKQAMYRNLVPGSSVQTAE
jgi:hypothetical protein